eukprot:GHVU01165415.1.p1 GENE.GHVU01165415.1~~GHVU01165415.1.p1  ORF type:complete len:354 (+),score=26.13 GHVU01165415.1:588-1649(+)
MSEVERICPAVDGAPGDATFRVHFRLQDVGSANATPVSPWHHIPLHGPAKLLRMVVEIPKNTKHKMEVNTRIRHNPIMQDVTKDGRLREYPGPLYWNYGMLPQTWEDPNEGGGEEQEREDGAGDGLRSVESAASTGVDDPGVHRHRYRGDCDPLDAVEVGPAALPVGSIVEVKVSPRRPRPARRGGAGLQSPRPAEGRPPFLCSSHPGGPRGRVPPHGLRRARVVQVVQGPRQRRPPQRVPPGSPARGCGDGTSNRQVSRGVLETARRGDCGGGRLRRPVGAGAAVEGCETHRCARTDIGEGPRQLLTRSTAYRNWAACRSLRIAPRSLAGHGEAISPGYGPVAVQPWPSSSL